MPSEVHAGVTLVLSKGQHRTAFRNPRGLKRYYAFYDDGPALRYEWSTDGADWSNFSVNISGLAVVESFDVKWRDDGSQLVVWVAWHEVTETKYLRGTIADGSSTISWGSVQTIDAAINDVLTGAHCIAIARTDNGRHVVAFTEDTTVHGKDYRQTKLIGSDGDGAAPTWSGETTWDDPSGSTNNNGKDQVWFALENYSGSVLSGNGVHITASLPNSTATNTYYAQWDAITWNGTAFSSPSQVSLGIGSPSHGIDCIALLIDAGDIAHCILENENITPDVLLHLYASSAGTDSLAFGEEAVSNSAGFDACTLALDTGPATDELYAFYHKSDQTTDFHYVKTPVDTISWGTEQTITFASDMIALTSWNRDVEGSLHISLEDADTDVHYHEHVLTAPPDPIPDRLVMVPQAVNRASTY